MPSVARLYTGLGDNGSTDLLGDRVAKDDPRIDVLGIIDEATSAAGLGRALAHSERTKTLIEAVQRDLYRIMAELAFTDDMRPAGFELAAERVAWLETVTDEITAALDLPPSFILPGDTVPGAALDVARTVARRAERAVVRLRNEGHVGNEQILRYLNRLSSLLFVLARHEDHEAGVTPQAAKVR